MGTKRPHTATDEPAEDEEECGTAEYSHVKRRKHKTKQGTSEFVKKRLRSLERLLQRKQGLPADVQNDLERELSALRANATDRLFQKKRSAMISKYHMVRFFERKKASRLVRQLRRQIEEDPNGERMEELKHDLHVAEVDEAYSLYHPYLEPYVSLYGSAKAAESDGSTHQEPAAKMSLKSERPPLWAIVEETMTEGPEALTRLRERRPEADAWAKERKTKWRPRQMPAAKMPDSGPQRPKDSSEGHIDGKTVPSNVKEGSQQLNRRQRRQLMHQAKAAAIESDAGDANGDAGGFFEGI